MDAPEKKHINMDEEKKYARLKKLESEHGWKLSVPSNVLPQEDRAPLNGGLRCFGKVCQRDTNGNKLKDQPRKRCSNPTVKGSFFCRKCGGGNSNALTFGRSTTGTLYKGAFKNQLGNLLDAFMSDPAILDLVPELSALRLAYRQFLEKISSSKPTNPKKLVRMIRRITRNKMLSDEDKFTYIKDLCSRELTISDPNSLMIMKHITEAIGNTVEKIYKIETRDDFLLTPDGLKILLRCITDIIKNNVTPEVLEKVKKELIEINIRTGGDIRKYVDEKQSLKPKLELDIKDVTVVSEQ